MLGSSKQYVQIQVPKGRKIILNRLVFSWYVDCSASPHMSLGLSAFSMLAGIPQFSVRIGDQSLEEFERRSDFEL